MMIQVVGNRIKCVRQKYDASRGRGVSQQVLSCPRFTDSIEDIREEKALEQLKALTEEERQQLADWLIEQTAKRELITRKYRLTSLTGTLGEAVEALADEQSKSQLTPEKADAIWLKIRELQQALKAAGFKRPKLSGGEAE